MGEKKLNTVAVAYRQGNCGFDTVYDVYAKIYSAHYEKLAIVHELDPHDVQAGYEDTLLEVLQRFDPEKGVFAHYLKRSLRNKLTDLQREKARRSREVSYGLPTGDADEKNVFYMIESGQKLEEEIAEKEISDKRARLIAEMVSNADPAIKNILKEILAGHSVHSAAKHYGICHKTVKRRLDKMTALYDEHRHGDIRDYLTV